jgi:hypothetical protein
MSVAALLTGGALLVASYAFHWRARLLGDNAHGWPAAPLVIRLSIDAAALVFLFSGLWLVVAGRLPAWLQAALAVCVAAYSVVFAVNISRQRQSPGMPK